MQLIFSDQTYEKASGGDNLVYEIVKSVHNTQNIMSVLIGSKKSFVVKRLTEDKIPFRFYDQDQLMFDNVSTAADDLMINFNNFDGLHKFRGFCGRNILWGILAPQILGWNRFGIEKKLTGKKIVGNFFTKKLLLSMNHKNALISMDGATSDAIDDFIGEPLNLPIISIPVDVNDIRIPKKTGAMSSNLLQVSYIGRSDDLWKIKPVKKIIQDFSRVKNKKFIINVYTDCADPYVKELQNLCGANISVKYHTGLYGPQIRTHINMHSDIHFSMGTAALEGALSGVATILIDPCVYDLPLEYKYNWLFQTTRNSLGRFIGKDEMQFSGMDMAEVIETCFDEKRQYAVATSCSKYVMENHSALAVAEKLVACPTRAGIKDIFEFTPATWRGVAKIKNMF